MNDFAGPVAIPRRVDARFFRRVQHTLQLGVVVTYEMDAFPFAVTAHRDGIEIIGKTPPLPPEAVDIFIQCLRRSQLQHAHLRTFEVGTKQEPLTEDQLKDLLKEEKETHATHRIDRTAGDADGQSGDGTAVSSRVHRIGGPRAN